MNNLQLDNLIQRGYGIELLNVELEQVFSVIADTIDTAVNTLVIAECQANKKEVPENYYKELQAKCLVNLRDLAISIRKSIKPQAAKN